MGCLLTLVYPTLQAAHITDKMAVAFYLEETDDTPQRLLTSGTPVERLGQNRDASLCKVRLGNEQTGWLECRYITNDKPARAMLLDAQARNGELRRRIADLQQNLQLYAQSAAQDATPAVQEKSAAPVASPARPASLGWTYLLVSLLLGAGLGVILTLLFLRHRMR